MKKEKFPVWIFTVYLAYFAGQAVYNTYLNLYLSQIGFSTSQIGMVISISTGILLLSQTVWGIVSDRAKSKNRVIRLLYLLSGVSVLGFYLTESYLPLLVLVCVFTAFFAPIVPLNDNITLEALLTSRWDYGWLRMGGTIGYALTVLFIGSFLEESYAPIFMIVAVTMFVCFAASLQTPTVRGHRNKEHQASMTKVLSNKTLLGLIGFNLIYGLGNSFFYSFYPIRFVQIGGSSRTIGRMMFACSVAEIPCLMAMHRIVKKIGIRGVLTAAGAMTCVRWLLLSRLRSPAVIIAVNLMHGFAYTGITYCVLNFINQKVPKELRAGSQVWNATMATVCSKLIFGYIGGLVFDTLGADFMMILSAASIGAATVWFALWSRKRKEELYIL